MRFSWKSQTAIDRGSHEAFFFHQRDWSKVECYWGSLLRLKVIPSVIAGDEIYGITKLKQLSFDNRTDFQRNDPKEKRQTFAFVIGYDGNQYNGYQQQKGSDVRTVEDDLDLAFKRKLIASGRTDKGVSALSQVVSFSTYDKASLEDIVSIVKSSEPFQSNRLALWDAERVPRKFHPIFSATWRRYVYIFPVNHGSYGSEGIDVDCNFINRCFDRYNQSLTFVTISFSLLLLMMP